MNKHLALFAAAATLAIANTALSPVAQAGGVRLQFGYPLGSFVARECGSCGNSSYGHHSHRSYRDYGAERRAAARAAARAEAIAEARREKAAEARREAIAEARRARVAEERRERLAEARRTVRAAKESQEKEVAKVEIETLAPDTVPLPVRAEDKKEASVAVGEPKVVLSSTKDEASNAAPKAEKVAIAPVPAAAPIKAEISTKPLDCKKFVPSAGLTITVPCQ
ncbi:MAG: hypothetical protein KDJ47_16820 [Hyphomicrobiaceae bacterium]|nr:hypothetical protein [Hyphomicrobiaceae bacterium]